MMRVGNKNLKYFSERVESFIISCHKNSSQLIIYDRQLMSYVVSMLYNNNFLSILDNGVNQIEIPGFYKFDNGVEYTVVLKMI